MNNPLKFAPKYLPMQTKRFSEKKVILFTASLILFSGIIRLMSYLVGIILFYLSFVPYLAYRLYFLHKMRNDSWSSLEKSRFVVLIIMVVTIIFNLAGWQEADFFLLFLVMIDFLLVSNQKI